MARLHNIRSWVIPMAAAVLFGGCDDFLAENPAGTLTSVNFFQNGTDAVNALSGAYQALHDRNYVAGRSYVEILELPTPQLASRAGNLNIRCLDNFVCSTDNVHWANVWQGIYEAINAANAVIDNVPQIEKMNPGLRDRVVAEAKFLRAFHYFNLVRLYGGVPLRENETTSLADLRQPRAPADEIYSFVIKDLTEAQQALPVSYPASDWGRATRGAAQTLLGKVYLQRGVAGKSNPFGDPLYWPTAQPGDLQKAEAELRKVIQSGQYRLVDQYRDLWREETEKNSEVIFAMQNILYPGQGSHGGSNAYAPFRSGWGRGQNASGNGELPFYLSYAEGDVRRGVTWLTEYVDIFGKRKKWDPNNIQGDTWPREGPAPDKYLVHRTDIATTFSIPLDQPILRYADVLLMLAETLLEQNKTGEALQLVNQVRARAGVAPLTALDREAMYWERNWELATEQHAWYDAARFWDLFKEQSHRHSMLYQTNPKKYPRWTVPEVELVLEDKHRLVPIPQEWIDRNPKLVQNPGW